MRCSRKPNSGNDFHRWLVRRPSGFESWTEAHPINGKNPRNVAARISHHYPARGRWPSSIGVSVLPRHRPTQRKRAGKIFPDISSWIAGPLAFPKVLSEGDVHLLTQGRFQVVRSRRPRFHPAGVRTDSIKRSPMNLRRTMKPVQFPIRGNCVISTNVRMSVVKARLFLHADNDPSVPSEFRHVRVRSRL